MIDWRKRKTIVFESDDWGGLDRGFPDMATRRKLAKKSAVIRALTVVEHKKRRVKWHMDTLESVGDLEALFKLLLNYCGADGRPAVFTPVYLLASPDYKAIKANGFSEYVDIGIDKKYPPLYRKNGDIIGRAREGMRLGVWVPESHNTRMAGHIDPHAWVRLLRDRRDGALNVFFENNMIGFPSDVPRAQLGWEFDSMGREQLREWVAVGTRYFCNAFGYAPRAAGISDARTKCKVLEEFMEEILVKNGVKLIFNAANRKMGEYDPTTKLTYIKRNVNFEPSIGAEKNRLAWRSAYRAILRAWENNEPAIVGTHRKNYVGIYQSDGLRQLESLLDIIRRKHPDAVYMASCELEPLYRRAGSPAKKGTRGRSKKA